MHKVHEPKSASAPAHTPGSEEHTTTAPVHSPAAAGFHPQVPFNPEQIFELLENANDLFYTQDLDGNFTWVNNAALELTGYTLEEARRMNMRDIVAPEYRELADVARQQRMAGKAVPNYEIEIIAKGGHRLTVEISARVIFRDGNPVGVQGTARDVTERKSTKRALESSELRLRLHAQQTMLGVVEFNSDFRIVEWNPAAERIFGYERSQMLGQTSEIILTPKSKSQVAEAYSRIWQHRQSMRSIHENRTRSGRMIACEWSYTPLVDESGKLLGVIGLVQDVSERNAAEDALRRSEERYRLLFERNLAAVYWATAEGELVDCNESFARMFGYRSRSEVMMQRSLDFYQHLGDRETLLRNLREQRLLTNVESLCRRKDGQPIWVLQNVTLIEGANGDAMIQGTMIDITERKFAEQNLRQAEGRFRSIFENAAEGIFQTTLDGRWLIANPKLAQILGYNSPEELIADPELRRRYYLDAGRRRDFTRRLQLEGAISGFESQVYRKDGQVIWISESARAVRDERGNLVGYEGTVQDITERRHAEDALRQSERRLRKQTEMLLDLSQRKIIEAGNLPQALREITEASAETLEVDRASVWLFSESGEELLCTEQYFAGTREHTSGERYAIGDFPVYFEALQQERVIDADDVHNDSRTMEFSPIFKQQGITSMLEAVIRLGGDIVGTVCLEHTGEPRAWTLDEKNFAGSMADLLSLAIEAEQRRRTQDALQESESKFRAVADSAASAIYIHNGEKFLFCNQAAETISGYSREELLAMGPFEIVHPEDRDFVAQRFRSRMGGDFPPPRYEYRIVTRQGETRWLDFNAGMISFEGKTALLGTAFDITERKRAEQLQAALYRVAEKTSTARDLDEFFAAIHAILGELVYSRNLFIALYEPRTQMLHFPYWVDEHDPPCAPHKLGKGFTEYVLRSGQAYLDTPERELELIERGEVELIGTPSVAWLGMPLKSGDETFGVLVLQSYNEQHRFGEREKEILTFVSQSVATAILRKRDEDALRHSEARYRSQVQSAVYGIYRSSVDDRFLDANPALVSMLGYGSLDEVLALRLGRDVYFDPSQRTRLINEYGRQEQIAGIEVQWKRKDGKPITVRLSGRTLRGEGGEIEGFEMLAEDITERHTLEEQLRQSQKMEAVGRLAGGVAHDFNNLLTVIKGYSELMLDQVRAGDPLRAEVDEIKKAADRAATLTRQLLAFSRKQVLEPRVLDLNQVVVNMEKLLRRLIGEDVELITTLDPALGRAKADPGQTEQVIMNLAVNARDAMPTGGKMIISTANIKLEQHSLPQHAVNPGMYVRLDVADTGTGMDPETQSRIFEPFFTTKEQGKGTGLGLSTVYGIVKQSGGYIEVESQLGQGTRFSVYLPRVEEAEQQPSASTTPVKQLTGTETILLVEDEDGVRTLARQLLQKQGYTVLDTRHGGEALLTCERHQGAIHLLLTDVILSQMSGRELAERLGRLRPEMKVLYMSGYSGDAVAQHGILDLAASFLQKPFSTESLITKVREVLDSRRAKSAVQ